MTKITSLYAKGFKSFAKPTELMFSDGYNCIIGPNGAGKSLSYDTVVTLSNGKEIEIGKLVEDKLKESKEIKTLKDGIYVDGDDLSIISINPITMKAEEIKIAKYVKREGEKLYKIATRSGKEVKATGCHPVMVFKEGVLKSVLINEINVHDYIVTPRKIVTNSKTGFDKDEGRLLGLLIGDGVISERIIRFTNQDENIINNMIEILDNRFKIKTKKNHYKPGNTIDLYWYDKSLLNWTKKLFSGSLNAENKFIPNQILESDLNVVGNFLAGLFDTDGSVRKDLAIIEFCSKSKQLSYQVQRLLLRFGILSKVKKRMCCASNTINKTKREYFYVYIYGYENIKKFYMNIPLKCQHKKENLELLLNKNVIANPNVDLLPKETNILVKNAVKLLGIKVKLLRKDYPKLSAYVENRCNPTRNGLNEILPILDNKLMLLYDSKLGIKKEVFGLINLMDNMHISGRSASSSLGLSNQVVRTHWASGKFLPKEENLNYFYEFIKETVTERLEELKQVMNSLHYLAESDIFWDEVKEVKEVEEEKYVYDLTIPENHNFIGNGIFVHNSNIVDLITFVLGKSSAKAMRAEKSPHLIYNGGKSKDPAKEAVATITFDNTNHEFASKEKEVKVSRVIKQSGNSVYRLNNDVVTRQQILDLLNSAKIDPNAHNIVLQGDIVHFMDMKPYERRKILEEVAGISVYDEKKEKSLHELEKVDVKLNEADIILKERGNYLKELKNDRDDALRYKEAQDEIKRNKATLLNLQIKAKEELKNDIEKRISQSEEEKGKIQEKIDSLKTEIVDNKNEIKKINAEIDTKGEKEQVEVHHSVEELRTSIIKKESRISILENEIQRVNERKKQLRVSHNETNAKISSLEKEINNLERKNEVSEKELKRIENEILRFKEKNNITDYDSLDKSQDEFLKLKDEQQRVLRENDKLVYQLNEIDSKLANSKNVDNKDLRKKFKEATAALSKALNDDAMYASLLGRGRREVVEKEEELAKINIKNFSANEKISASLAVDKILNSGIKGVYNTIHKLGEADPKYGMALEVAAGARILSLVTQDDTVAAKCIKYLKENKLGVATFLPLNKMNSKSSDVKSLVGQKGVINLAINLVRFDPKFRSAFEYVFGSTLVVDDIETARYVGIGKARMVTLEGDLTETSGAMIGGHRKSLGLSFKEKGSDDKIALLENEVSQLKQEITALENKRMKNEELISTLRQEKGNLEGEIMKIEKAFGGFDLEGLQKERNELNFKVKEYTSLLKEMDVKINSLDKILTNLKDKKQKFNVEGKEKLEELEGNRAKLKEETIKFSSDLKSLKDQKETIHMPELAKVQNILVSQDKELNDFDEELNSVKEEIKNGNIELKDKEKKEKEFYNQFRSLFGKRDKVNLEIQKLETNLVREEERIRMVDARFNNINIDKARINAELKTIVDEFENFKDVSLKRGLDIDSLKTEINSLEKEMTKMGNVNMRALEVYNEIFTEFEVLKEKADRLRVEKVDVLNLINEIETKKKGLFMKTYKNIAGDFSKIFSNLTTKGNATLELEDEEEPLKENNGVAIKVRLNTNKYLDLKSLSGGEKTLAALSLIFAIQEYMPASFYLFDEVDAALDKRNSELLSKLIAQYSKKAQYLVVSHNDSVIGEAESVYGVSMTDGVSKVVSLKL